MADKYESLRKESKERELGTTQSGKPFHPAIAKNTNKILASVCDLAVRDSYEVLSQDSCRRLAKQRNLEKT